MTFIILIWSIFFTGADLLTSSITPQGTVPFNKVKKLSKFATQNNMQNQPEAPKRLPNTSTLARTQQSEEESRTATEESRATEESKTATATEIARALHLAKLVYPKNIKVTDSLPQKITATFLHRIRLIKQSIENYKEAFQAYELLQRNKTAFITTINEMLPPSEKYLHSTTDVNVVFANFINKIFASMIKSDITNDTLFYRLMSIFSKKDFELNLLQDIEIIIEHNIAVAHTIHDFLIELIEILTHFKKIFLNDENKDLELSYFNKTLPIDTWITLTKKLSENILLITRLKQSTTTSEEADKEKPEAITKTKETRSTADSTTKPEIKALSLDLLEKEAQQDFENIAKEHEQDLTKISTTIHQAKEHMVILQKLKAEIAERFSTLQSREKDTVLPEKLTDLNHILEYMNKLLQKDPFEDEKFRFLLDSFYELLLDQKNLNFNPIIEKTKTPAYDSYIINNNFNSEDLYQPLYNIIIFKLNTLLKAYAIKNGQISNDKKITITVDFLISETEEKTYSFDVSINDLQAYNENAYFIGRLGAHRLVYLANPASWTEPFTSIWSSVKNLASYSFSAAGNGIDAAASFIKAGWTRIWHGSEEYQENQRKIKNEIENKRKIKTLMMQEIINSFKPSTVSQQSTPQTPTQPPVSASTRAITPQAPATNTNIPAQATATEPPQVPSTQVAGGGASSGTPSYTPSSTAVPYGQPPIVNSTQPLRPAQPQAPTAQPATPAQAATRPKTNAIDEALALIQTAPDSDTTNALNTLRREKQATQPAGIAIPSVAGGGASSGTPSYTPSSTAVPYGQPPIVNRTQPLRPAQAPTGQTATQQQAQQPPIQDTAAGIFYPGTSMPLEPDPNEPAPQAAQQQTAAATPTPSSVAGGGAASGTPANNPYSAGAAAANAPYPTILATPAAQTATPAQTTQSVTSRATAQITQKDDNDFDALLPG